MAQQLQPLPPWLKWAVKCGAITEPKAYLMHWLCQQDMEWVVMPPELEQEARQIYLLELPAGRMQ